MTKILIDEALRLAEQLECMRMPYCGLAAAELRRLYAENQALRQALAEQPAQQEPLTEADYYNACLSYRHDFGLMPDEDRQKLIFEAKEWARAFGITKGNT